MIVTLRASPRQSEESARSGVHPVILHLRTQRVKSQPDPQIFVLSVLNKVAGDLCLHKKIVRHILIEGPDYPIPITECVRIRIDLFSGEAIVGVAGDVQPETSPS